MAKVEMTAREQRHLRVWREYEATLADPDNHGASAHAIAMAVAKKTKVPVSTVKDIIRRRQTVKEDAL